MPPYTIVNPGNLATGQPAHIEDVLSNLQAIQLILNGGIDTTNIDQIALNDVATLVYTQSTPATSWAIIHNLGKFPSVDVVDSGGTILIPDVIYVDGNNITVNFVNATSGKAYLN